MGIKIYREYRGALIKETAITYLINSLILPLTYNSDTHKTNTNSESVFFLNRHSCKKSENP